MTAFNPHSDRPLWRDTARGDPCAERLTADITVDVAVVGGGFTGLTAALHLAERGARVAVFEAFAIGDGASGRNAGFVVPNFAKADPATVIAALGPERGRRLLDLVGRGADRVFENARRYQIDCDAEQIGWLQPASTEAMRARLRDRVAAWRDLGRPLSFIDADETRRQTGVQTYRGSLFDPSGGTIHPLSYLFGLSRAARDRGAAIFSDAKIDAIERSGTAWILRCGARTIRADKILMCTNASDDGAARRLAKLVVPLAVYQIATQPLPADLVARFSPMRRPVSDTRGYLFTYRFDRDNRLISGGMSMAPIAAHQRMGAAILRRLAIELDLEGELELAYVWRGVAAMTMDFMPHLYEFGPGYIGAIGCNGRGVALTAMLGETLADAAGGAPLASLPIPLAQEKKIPFHLFARAAPSFAIAHARYSDWRAA